MTKWMCFRTIRKQSDEWEYLRYKAQGDAQSQNRHNDRGEYWQYYYIPLFGRSQNRSYCGKGGRFPDRREKMANRFLEIRRVRRNLCGNSGNTHRTQDGTLKGEIWPKAKFTEEPLGYCEEMKWPKSKIMPLFMQFSAFENWAGAMKKAGVMSL